VESARVESALFDVRIEERVPAIRTMVDEALRALNGRFDEIYDEDGAGRFRPNACCAPCCCRCCTPSAASECLIELARTPYPLIFLSFAQFEREIIGERTRDKMSALRRKGKRTGGHPVLGYDIDLRGGRLICNSDEAHRVGAIFQAVSLLQRYNAMLPVVREIERRGWHAKQWVTKRGETQGGKAFTKRRLYRLSTNPIYTGSVHFKGQVHDGEQEAIIKTETWESVQAVDEAAVRLDSHPQHVPQPEGRAEVARAFFPRGVDSGSLSGQRTRHGPPDSPPAIY
jgi:hypothetical protein